MTSTRPDDHELEQRGAGRLEDVIVVISNCPEALNPAAGGNQTPVRTIRYRGR